MATHRQNLGTPTREGEGGGEWTPWESADSERHTHSLEEGYSEYSETNSRENN